MALKFNVAELHEFDISKDVQKDTKENELIHYLSTFKLYDYETFI